MRVYIASKYIEHKEINEKIYNALIEAHIDAFLPISINVDAISDEEMKYVAESCYDEVDKCDIMLVVFPFGRSVSSEIGYAISKKRKNQNMKLVLFNQIFDEALELNNEANHTIEDVYRLKKEAMLMPYFDEEVSDISELIDYLKK